MYSHPLSRKGLPPMSYECAVAENEARFLPTLACLTRMRRWGIILDLRTDEMLFPDPKMGGFQRIPLVFTGFHYILPLR